MSPNQPAEPKPTVTRNSSEFNKDAYASIPSGELVVFAVQVLQADGSPAATEDIVSICFRFFPHSFALKNYFYWPDSALVTRRLHDAKEKGLLKGNAADGFEVKVPGRQAAKHVAKALGVVFPAPPKVEIPAAPVEEIKETVPSVPVKDAKKRETRIEEAQTKVKGEKKKAGKPVVKKKPQAKPKKETPRVTAPIKRKIVSKPKARPKPAPSPKVTTAKKPLAKIGKKDERRKKIQVKTAPKAPVTKKPLVKLEKNAVKKRETGRKATQPAVKPVVKKVEPKIEKVVEKKQGITKKGAKATAHPKQLTMPLPPPPAWKKAESPATKPKVKKEPPLRVDKIPVKKEEAAPAVVSKEEKDKAAKVVKQIERSDAYQLYRRNGRRANIGEFDFRNMLFATMESSAETLNRNVNLFKRYAGIQYRTDLVAFLEFCEESFSALLISKVKVKGKR